MKIRLSLGAKRRKEVADFLTAHGVEIDDDADLVLSEEGQYADRIPVRKINDSEKLYIPADDIVYLESYGHSVYVHATSDEYVTNDPLYQLERKLNPSFFVRVSASVLVAHTKIRQIKPTISRKYVLILSNGGIVDVTRSYYTQFKEKFNL